MKKILHLCADLGSDSRYYELDNEYEVIKIGQDIGVENFSPPEDIYGVIANPPCTEFSTAKCFSHVGDIQKGMELVNHCFRIIEECGDNLNFWVMENPARGRLREQIGKPKYIYQPWHYGSPWTKQTALWGEFNVPERKYTKWEDVPNKIPELWIREGRTKPALVYLHKSAINLISEFEFARDHIKCDADIRSMCSQGFAKAFYESNK